MMGPRTVEMYDYVLKNKSFDYIFRVNAGSYIRQDKLLNFLINKPKRNFYCGIQGNYKGVKYASGSGYFLSHDLVEKVVQNKEKLKLTFFDGVPMVDDVAIGELLKVSVCDNAKRCSVKDDKYIYENCNEDDVYQYRVRSDYDRNKDIQKIEELHEKYKK